MRARLTYVPEEVAERFEGREAQNAAPIGGVIGTKVRDYSLVSIVKMLYQLQGGPKTFSGLFACAGIRYKKSYIAYLKLCTEYSLVKREDTKQYSLYYLSKKGRMLVSMFMEK